MRLLPEIDMSYLEEKAMVKCRIEPKIDIHEQRAMEMYGVSKENVTHEMRKTAKMLNHIDMYAGFKRS